MQDIDLLIIANWLVDELTSLLCLQEGRRSGLW
jgi:hypothetical protein